MYKNNYYNVQLPSFLVWTWLVNIKIHLPCWINLWFYCFLGYYQWHSTSWQSISWGSWRSIPKKPKRSVVHLIVRRIIQTCIPCNHSFSYKCSKTNLQTCCLFQFYNPWLLCLLCSIFRINFYSQKQTYKPVVYFNFVIHEFCAFYAFYASKPTNLLFISVLFLHVRRWSVYLQ